MGDWASGLRLLLGDLLGVEHHILGLFVLSGLLSNEP